MAKIPTKYANDVLLNLCLKTGVKNVRGVGGQNVDKQKILVIADIHGRNNWKDKADINKLLKNDTLTPEYDKYIFLGDYVDSFDETDAVILYNLQEIIQFKDLYPHHVILLLGNHDLQYYYNYEGHGCSGYRPTMYKDLHTLFIENKELFLPCYRIKNYLFTHAGVTTVWWNKIKRELLGNENSEYSPEYIINREFNRNESYSILYDVGRARGGWNKSGGPFWADKSESSAWVLPKYHQVVGHHPIKEIPYMHILDKNSSITYVDNNKTGSIELII